MQRNCWEMCDPSLYPMAMRKTLYVNCMETYGGNGYSTKQIFRMQMWPSAQTCVIMAWWLHCTAMWKWFRHFVDPTLFYVVTLWRRCGLLRQFEPCPEIHADVRCIKWLLGVCSSMQQMPKKAEGVCSWIVDTQSTHKSRVTRHATTGHRLWVEISETLNIGARQSA